MTQRKQGKMTLEHMGDHHQAMVNYDPKKKKISGGIVNNFSNNSAVGLMLDASGKVTGTLVHSGDTHGFRADVRSDGKFNGVYIDKKKGIELKLAGGVAELKKGKIPQAGLTLKGDHHIMKIGLNKEGKISGGIRSNFSKDGSFGIDIKDGKIMGGTFIHKGKNHNSTFSLGQDGWSAKISSGKGRSKWSFGVKNGKSTMVSGNLKIKF